jgi:hypothetical protein
VPVVDNFPSLLILGTTPIFTNEKTIITKPITEIIIPDTRSAGVSSVNFEIEINGAKNKGITKKATYIF